jgi:hypothetical protein
MITPEEAQQLYRKIDLLEQRFTHALDLISTQGKLIKEMHNAFYPRAQAKASKREQVEEMKHLLIKRVARNNTKRIQETGSKLGEQ